MLNLLPWRVRWAVPSPSTGWKWLVALIQCLGPHLSHKEGEGGRGGRRVTQFQPGPWGERGVTRPWFIWAGGRGRGPSSMAWPQSGCAMRGGMRIWQWGRVTAPVLPNFPNHGQPHGWSAPWVRCNGSTGQRLSTPVYSIFPEIGTGSEVQVGGRGNRSHKVG